MNDDFLHRLRKEPRPQFAARLQTRLRQQSLSPIPPKAPSGARTLLILLLLGGTAFAVTAMLMRGIPPPLLALYQHASAWITAERTAAPGHRTVTNGVVGWLRWGGSWASPPHGATRSQPTHSAAAAATSAPFPQATAGGSVPGRGAPFTDWPVISVLTSWAAYPHVEDVANRAQGMRVHVSVGNPALWHDWPQAMCSDKPSAPDLAYTFEAVGTVSARPCPASPGSPVTTIPVGYVAVALARSPIYGALDLTRRQVFLALAKWVPDPARPGTVHENGATVWRQIDAAQGPEPIQVMGPAPSSELGRAMIALLMEGGCNTYPWIAALKSSAPDKYDRICRTVRTDGAYREVANVDGGQDLLGAPNALGILGFAELMSTPGERSLAISKLDGVAATRQNIENGTYPGSRGIYVYHNRLRPQRVLHFFFPFQFSDGELLALPEPQRQAAINEALH